MGSAQSSDIKREAAELAPTSSSNAGSDDSDMWTPINSSFDDESDADESEDEEAVEERLRILEDSRKLSMMAEFFLHPEKPVKSTPNARGRCYFKRASAPQQSSLEDSEEAKQVLDEVKALKKLAKDFRHPELPIESTDATACARCYFERASAPGQVPLEEDEEKARILSEMKALKKAAYDYLHPEAPVATTDPTIFGRNYFSRFSAAEMQTEEEELERELILKDARELSKLASNAPIKVDPAAMGRNYFSRPSAPEQTTLEEEEEIQQILKDAKALRKLATDYMHPELPVETDPTAFGRNYFNRPSAPEQEDEEADEDRQLILEEAKALRKLATDYMHPELPVETDPTAFGRNYFSRPSAPQQEDEEADEDRQLILEEAKALRKLATDYMHPELPVETDPTAFGRNYFNRPSAPEQEDDERQLILEEAKALRKLATDYMHPELPVIVTDPTVFGRNYFNRPSAPVQPASNEDEEQILADAVLLERLAMAYHHPELPVQTEEQMVMSRNYYYPKMHGSDVDNENDGYTHHAHFDMDDDIHLHHVEFDRNTEHHNEISEVKISTPTATRAVVDDTDLKLAMSPGCVMTFGQKANRLHAPELA